MTLQSHDMTNIVEIISCVGEPNVLNCSVTLGGDLRKTLRLYPAKGYSPLLEQILTQDNSKVVIEYSTCLSVVREE